MSKTLFLYARDQDDAPIFFRSDVSAHFVRGPIKDNATRPVYFTGGPAQRPSYTMLPSATAGDPSAFPGEFFTLGLPRPSGAGTPASLVSTISFNSLSVEPYLLATGNNESRSGRANSDLIWSLGNILSNGIDDVLVYMDWTVVYQKDVGWTNDSIQTTVSLVVDGVVVDSFRNSGIIDEEGGAFRSGILLRAPATQGQRLYELRVNTTGDSGVVAALDRTNRYVESDLIRVFHEHTTITVNGDARSLEAGDLVEISSIGASFTSTSTNTNHFVARQDGFFGLNTTEKVRAAARAAASFTSRNLNGARSVVRSTSSTIVIDGAWPWDLTSSGAGGTLSFESIGDPSSSQEMGYVMTFLTTVGSHVQEGPPSQMSPLVSSRPGMPVQLTGLPTSTIEEGVFRLSGKRLYRTNVTSDGYGVLQFLAELPIGDTEYLDTVRAVDLGEELQTQAWIMPPSDMHSMVACHNGMLAGISGNEVCVSVPFQPHAWPIASRFKIGDDPIALVSVGESIMVLTNGRPSVVHGFEPESMRVAMVEAAYPCLSAAGAVSIGDAVIYPSTIGLVSLPTRGAPMVVTQALMEKEEWAKYRPETIIATEHFGKYLGFYKTEDEDDEDVDLAFLLDPQSRVSSLTDIVIAADACCTDERSGQALFLAAGEDDVYLFDPVEGDEMPYLWRSKTYATQRPWCPGYARVVAEDYPVTFRLYANKQQPGGSGGGGTTEATMGLILEKLVPNSKPFSLPGNYMANAFEIELANNDGDTPPEIDQTKIISVGVASTAEELLKD